MRPPGTGNMNKQRYKEQKFSVSMGKSTVTIFIEKYSFDLKRNVLKLIQHLTATHVLRRLSGYNCTETSPKKSCKEGPCRAHAA